MSMEGRKSLWFDCVRIEKSLWFHSVRIGKNDYISTDSTSQNTNDHRGNEVREQTATNVANGDLPSVQTPGGGGPSVDVEMHDVADLTPLWNSQMEVETEQEQANLVGVKHGNELNDQPMSANESESLFIDSEETVSSQAHVPPELDAQANVVTQQLVNAQTNTAKARPKQLRASRVSI
ncbi:MAG: hypothetical protein LQ350_004964 [Teloschistes chrysophthalmus]|nr:MAG: hypothetical protein LQ350_004964 [Niorma chrysophthalma]